MADNRIACQKFERVLWAFVDGDMPERERVFWAQHTAECDVCRDRLNEARALELAYRRLPECEAPDALVRDLIDQVTAPGRVGRIWRRVRQRLPGRRVWQSSFLGALLLLGGMLIFNAYRHRRST